MTDPVDAVAAMLGFELPDECVEGVRENARLLAEHWAKLRAFDVPEDAP